MPNRKFKRRLLCTVIIFCCAMLILFTFTKVDKKEQPVNVAVNSLHFVAIVPTLNDKDKTGFQETMDQLSSEFNVSIELHEFATAVDQQQMLRISPNIGIDGVLLWPISADDEDYKEGLTDCREAGVPLVIIDRDIASNLRNSFIGSGASSDLLVLEQGIRAMDNQDTFAVGNRFIYNENQVVELLIFKKGVRQTLNAAEVQDTKLRELAESPPDMYHVSAHFKFKGDDARILNLKYILINLFSSESPPGMFFSLDNTLTTVSAAAKSNILSNNKLGIQLIGYGDLSEDQSYLDAHMINGVVTSKPDTSFYIGIRYLRDLYYGRWVPSTMDSGINFFK